MSKKTKEKHWLELCKVLIPYYESKPDAEWCMGKRHGENNTHCPIGFIENDFEMIDDGYSFFNKFHYSDSRIQSLAYKIYTASDGANYTHLPTPKQRVIAFLKDEITRLEALLNNK